MENTNNLIDSVTGKKSAINDFLQNTENLNDIDLLRPCLICNDGFNMSVQAGRIQENLC